jgi:hypothetical protein
MTMFRRLVLTAMLAGIAGPVLAAPVPKDYAGSFHCTEELSAGLTYDKDTKAWISTTFKPAPGFDLKLTYIGKSRDFPNASTFHADITGDDGKPGHCNNSYSVELKPDLAATDDVGVFECTDVLTHYRFNMSDLRFVRTYELGYLIADDADDTPSVSGGTCTRAGAGSTTTAPSSGITNRHPL